ncbi:hypothetical protein ACFV5N_00905 [Streptomyces sp. NPDC059853]|uniref:hypothetical protein n=1 Tax=Streptomyces sp. NPDC059853 TaxID=3346973 RepID=UPI00365BF869
MTFGPVSQGRLPFTVNGTAYSLLLPDDGRVLAGIAASGQWSQIVPGLLDDHDWHEWMDRLRDPRDPLQYRVCWRVALGLSERIYGMPWWAAHRLCAIAVDQWRVYEPWTVTRGFDPGAAPAHRICASILAWARAGCQKESELARLDHTIFTPPPEWVSVNGPARPAGFSDAELEQQAAQLAVYQPGQIADS